MKILALVLICVALPVLVHAQSQATRMRDSTFAQLNDGSPPNDSIRYCTNCQQTRPCAAGGTGAAAHKIAGVWSCTAGATDTGGGVSSITGTANQVIASSPTGAVTLSLPQSIGTSDTVIFGSVTGTTFLSTPAYLRFLESAVAPPVAPSGTARLYMDSTSHTVKLSQHGGSYFDLGSGGGGGANTSLSNLASVAINASLLPGTAGGIDVGSAARPFGFIFFSGSSGTPATNNFKLIGASTSGTRTIDAPDANTLLPIIAQRITFSGPTAARTYTLDDSSTTIATAAAALTSTAVVTGAGAGRVQTPSATTTLDTSGNVSTPGSLATGVGSGVAGNVGLTQGTATGVATNTIQLQAPTSVTGYNFVFPSSAFSGLIQWTNSANVVTGTNATAVNLSAPVFCSDAGASDTYACSTVPTPTLVTGTHYRFKANTANTGAATINFNSLGAITIVKVAGGITTALADNDIRVGQWVDLVYDGTNMQMQSTLGNASAGGGTTINPTDTAIPYRSNSTTFADTPLLRIDANTVEQRNSTTAQGFIVNETYTSGSNYRRTVVAGNGIFKQATGASDDNSDLFIRNGTNGGLALGAGNGTRWTIFGPSSGNDGALIPNNPYDLGSAALPVRTATITSYNTATNCADSAGAAACGAAAAGSVVMDAAATSVVVSTTAVTANSQIIVREDSSLNTRLSVTCNTTISRIYVVTARTAGTSFTITSSAAPVTNPACLSYFIFN